MNKNKIGTPEYTPSWEFAVQVYLAVLNNPDASVSGRAKAREEILRLARMVDKVNQATN